MFELMLIAGFVVLGVGVVYFLRRRDKESTPPVIKEKPKPATKKKKAASKKKKASSRSRKTENP